MEVEEESGWQGGVYHLQTLLANERSNEASSGLTKGLTPGGVEVPSQTGR